MKRILLLLLTAVLLFSTASCSSDNRQKNDTGSDTAAASGSAMESEQETAGRRLQIFCNEDLQIPLTEITAAFEQESGINIEIIFGSTEQLTNLISSKYTGDLFIAASESETGTLKTDGFITASQPLIKRLPVLAVPAGNPGRITNMKVLSRKKVCLADSRINLIGKIGLTILDDNGIDTGDDNVFYKNNHAELLSTLASGEADASIVWSELAEDEENVQILHSADLSSYAQTVPALSLSTCTDKEALKSFLDYLQSGTVKKIWKAHHYYETVK